MCRGHSACCHDTLSYLQASLRDLKKELESRVDVPEKQNAMRAVKGDVQARLLAFEELAIASLTRSVAAVYVVSIAQLFIHTQIFDLVRLQRLGRAHHEEAQRRFLSIIKHLHTEGDGHGPTLLSLIVARVEAAVRRFYKSVDHSTPCNPARLADIISTIRADVERQGGAGDPSTASRASADEAWALTIIRQLLLDSSGAILARKDDAATAADGAIGVGGGPEDSGVRLPPDTLGERADQDIRLQFLAMSHDMIEIIDSDLFSEVLLLLCSFFLRCCDVHVVSASVAPLLVRTLVLAAASHRLRAAGDSKPREAAIVVPGTLPLTAPARARASVAGS